uniref:Uncharacterized protein n=1 Tax=Ciona savignyi TaxID=51511 RepID=H2ZPV4_CIOSA
MAACCSRKQKPDIKHCVVIFAVGVVFILAGVPMMIAGIVGGFLYSDFIGYVGGVSIFFGIMFLFIWYMLSIPALEKKKLEWENSDIAVEATSAEISALSAGQTIGLHNLAFEKDLPGTSNASQNITISDMSSHSSQELPLAVIVNAPNSNTSNNNLFMFDNQAFELEESEPGVSSISGTVVSYKPPAMT